MQDITSNKLIALTENEKTNKVKITTANERLLSSGFIGCGEAESTLSENYKSELLNSMENKI